MSSFIFRSHPDIYGKHAFLSPSSYHWTNYDDDKLKDSWASKEATRRGTELHDFASKAIKAGVKLSDIPETLAKYADECLIRFQDWSDRQRKLIDLLNVKLEAERLGVELYSSDTTLNMFINDSIEHGLQSEVALKPFDDAFGTADAINYDEDEKRLVIFDLKTGVTPANIRQLELYAAYFCLEYGIKPSDISIELRIYQLNEITIANPDESVMKPLMKLVRHDSKIIAQLKKG